MKEKVYIILLNYNGWQDTIECLESVLKSDYKNYQIIVIDNFSPNNSMEKIIAWANGELDLVLPAESRLKHLCLPLEKKPIPYVLYSREEALKGGLGVEANAGLPLVLIQAGENRGFAAGNNLGIKYALKKRDGDFFWVLNNDTLIPKNFLSNILETMKKNRNVGLWGCKILDYFSPDKILGFCGCYSNFKASPWHVDSYSIFQEQTSRNGELYPIGASMICSKKFLDQVGFLNEEYFLYFEELDWVQRAKAQQFEIGFDFSNYIYHKEGGTIGSPIKKNLNVLSLIYLSRSHKKFIKNYKNRLFQFWFYFISLIRILKNLISFKKYSLTLFYSIFSKRETSWILEKMSTIDEKRKIQRWSEKIGQTNK